MSGIRYTGGLAVLSLILGLSLAACDQADPDAAANVATSDTFNMGAGASAACANQNNNTVSKLLRCVTLEGVRNHQATFQAIADANGGTRADDTPGFTASVDYVVQTLNGAGWSIERVPFGYPGLDALLQQLVPASGPYPTGAYTGSGQGDVSANVFAVDINLAPPRENTSGCEASDFAGFPVGSIALIQRGTCNFSVKALNAEAAGAVAVVIFNQGNTPGREGLIVGTLGGADVVGIPVVGASFADGVALAQPGSIAQVRVESVTIVSENVIAEKVGRTDDLGNPPPVVMLGAHLDSVNEGPGINDNGSGSAALLEVAVQMAKVKPRNTLRFAWWGAEELGLIGSDAYVDGLSSSERDAIAAYLNFDMIGSPNFVRFVYDGDGSDFGIPGPDGSAEIEAFFAAFYAERGLASEPTELLLRSANLSFLDVGISVGGVFTGAEVVKTPEQAAVYGGTAGDQYDPCYHLACDTFDNVSLSVLDLNADAVAAAALRFAMEPMPAGLAVPRTAASRRSTHGPEANRSTAPVK